MEDKEIFEFSSVDMDGNRMFDACLKVPYIYISKKWLGETEDEKV